MADVLPRILVIVAHPDDEVLLAGGTLAKYGGRVMIVGHGRGTPTDQRFDTEPLVDFITQIEAVVREYQPTVIITHHPADVNKDHRIIYEAVMSAARPPTYRGAIWAGEVPGSSDWWHERFTPNLFVELNQDQMVGKISAMLAYVSEVRDLPHPRSGKALHDRGRYWGSIAMCDYAEPFQIVREIR